MTDATPPPAPEPTTVVGYSATPSVPTAQVTPGMASLRSAVGTVRILVIASLVLLLVLAIGVVLGLASVRSQVADLQAQVASLAVSPASPQQPAAEAPAAAAERTIGAAPVLPEGVVVPVGADATGAVLVGDPNAASVVEVYVDYQCPHCQRWEQEVGAALVERALQPESGLLVKQYNLAFLGEESPTLEPPGASARAANAAACVLEVDGMEAFAAFNAGVFSTAAPADGSERYSSQMLADLASGIGAAPDTIACIEENRHVPYVAIATQAGFGRGVEGTPTVLVNGRTAPNPFTDPELISLIAG
jgi:protein-disulfide isomerase